MIKTVTELTQIKWIDLALIVKYLNLKNNKKTI